MLDNPTHFPCSEVYVPYGLRTLEGSNENVNFWAEFNTCYSLKEAMGTGRQQLHSCLRST